VARKSNFCSVLFLIDFQAFFQYILILIQWEFVFYDGLIDGIGVCLYTIEYHVRWDTLGHCFIDR
jgi:hypothetical protein